MKMQNPQDLFLFELSGLYDAEQKIARLLTTMAGEATDDRVRRALAEHLEETRQQIRNLDRVFEQLGSRPQQVSCEAMDGLQADRQFFLEQNPTPELRTMFDLGAAAKTEHYEMAAYRGLSEKAQLMANQELARLLQENLRQEVGMAEQAEQLGLQIAREQLQTA
jgi:ferritin-like metal-binding protein YciE